MWFLLFVFVGVRVDGVGVCRPRGWRRRMGVARLCYRARGCAFGAAASRKSCIINIPASQDRWLVRKYAWAAGGSRGGALANSVECSRPSLQSCGPTGVCGRSGVSWCTSDRSRASLHSIATLGEREQHSSYSG